MSLAKLLPPLTRSWADEVNEDLEEQFLCDITCTGYPVYMSKLDPTPEVEEDESLPPDFTDYEALESSDEEDMCDSYPSALNVKSGLNDRDAAAIISSDQFFSPNTNTLAKYMSMEIPKTLPYSVPGPNAKSFFNAKAEKEQHKEISRDEGQNETTTTTQYRLEAWEECDNGPLDNYDWSIESVQTIPELDDSLFPENSSQASSQAETEVDEEELCIDHPLMGEDVVGIRESFVAVKSREFDAHPPKVFYRNGGSQVWEWTPSNLRCCQTVVRDEGITYEI